MGLGWGDGLEAGPRMGGYDYRSSMFGVSEISAWAFWHQTNGVREASSSTNGAQSGINSLFTGYWTLYHS